MTKACEEEYILSGNQVLVLSAACGMDGITGFVPETYPTEADTLQAVRQLINSGLLYRADKGLKLAGGVRRIFDDAAAAAATAVVFPADERSPQICVFLGGESVSAIAPYAYRSGFFRAFGLPRKKLTDELAACGALPAFPGGEQPFIRMEDAEYEIMLEPCGLLSMERSVERPAAGDCVEAVIDMYIGNDGTHTRRMIVFDTGISRCCACVSREDTVYLPYTLKTAENWLEVKR